MKRSQATVAAALAGSLLAASCAAGDRRVYDPRADASKQLAAAAKRAAGGDKRVLAIIGGDW